MLRSKLVAELTAEFRDLPPGKAEQMVDAALERILRALEDGHRVELRGFGAFSVRRRKARKGRNPRTGAAVKVASKSVPFFKAGKDLRERVNPAPPERR